MFPLHALLFSLLVMVMYPRLIVYYYYYYAPRKQILFQLHELIILT